MSCSEFSLKESSGLLSIVQLSKFFVLSFATALIDYHIFRRLSTTFLFLLFQRCVLARNSLSRISCSSTFVNNFFSFHIFRIFVCASWTAVLLSPVSRDSLFNIAQQSHHCQQLFYLFSFLSIFTHLSTLHCEYTIFKASFFHQFHIWHRIKIFRRIYSRLFPYTTSDEFYRKCCPKTCLCSYCL